MPLNQGEDPGESRGVRLKQEPLESSAQVPEPVTRNAHGQSLDDAREAFRTEWEAKIREKHRQAEQARKYEEWWNDALPKLLIGGVATGTALGLLVAAASGRIDTIPFCLTVGIVIGILLVLPLILMAMIRAGSSRMRAERLEREVREMERS